VASIDKQDKGESFRVSNFIRTLRWPAKSDESVQLDREWIVTNGLGGYASGTVAGLITRRFHGLLVAALPSPFGRWMMLNDLTDQVCFDDGRLVQMNGEDRSNAPLRAHAAEHLREFRIEYGLPVWTYEVDGLLIEKRIFLPHGQNTVCLNYRIVSGSEAVRLQLRPYMHFRPHEGTLKTLLGEPYRVLADGDRYEFSSANQQLPPLRMHVAGSEAAFTFDRRYTKEVLYRTEEHRGYEARGDMWSPGYFHLRLSSDDPACVVASTESWEVLRAIGPEEGLSIERERRNTLLRRAHPAAQEGLGGELVLAADQFVITPAGRVEDVARARAAGDSVRTVIAGYHWFTDWGRDTMISLEGLTLATGRHDEAGWILRTFAYYVRDGLIPNMFPEGENNGLYHTADATLWFFHAIDRYIELTNDRPTLRSILPKLVQIVRCHLQGTRFGIGVDPADGLLRQGAPGYQLTWMDAKVEDWVVTPRRGKAVEINALWYNALKLLEGWLNDCPQSGVSAEEINEHAQRVRVSFNERFWYEDGGYLYDVMDSENGGNDSACRPNQLLSISLRHPVLDQSRWEQVVRVCQERLLTPVGLRSLAPGHPDYKSRYYGDLRSRDAAYHQGTVWGWLIGPFIDAWLKVYADDRASARRFLEGFEHHLENEGAIGSLSEIFDAEAPYHQRGCVAQAWSVAETLRCWVKTAS
jgi:predicted glycogen debranching enzyme